MCTVLLSPGANPIALNKYISYHMKKETFVAIADNRYEAAIAFRYTANTGK